MTFIQTHSQVTSVALCIDFCIICTCSLDFSLRVTNSSICLEWHHSSHWWCECQHPKIIVPDILLPKVINKAVHFNSFVWTFSYSPCSDRPMQMTWVVSLHFWIFLNIKCPGAREAPHQHPHSYPHPTYFLKANGVLLRTVPLFSYSVERKTRKAWVENVLFPFMLNDTRKKMGGLLGICFQVICLRSWLEKKCIH